MTGGRPLSEVIEDFLAAEQGETQTTVEFTCMDGDHLRFATDNLTLDGEDFTDDLIEADDIDQSEDAGTDRVKVTIQNVDKQIGIHIKNGKLDFAESSLGLLFKLSDGTTEWRENFFGEAIPESYDQAKAVIEILDDMVAAGYCVSNWTLAPRCNLIFKSNDCGYAGVETTCDKLLKGDCTKYANTHRFVGGTVVLLKNSTASSASSGSTSGGSSGGGGWVGGGPCFAGETAAILADDLKYELRFLEANKDKFIGQMARSFDAENRRQNGIIIDIYKSIAYKLAHVRFSGDAEITRVKPNHRYWTENFEFIEIQKLETGAKVWADERFAELVTLKFYEEVEYPEGIEVFNMTIDKYKAYTANGKRVSNSKSADPEGLS